MEDNIISCNIQAFSMQQTIVVLDKEGNEIQKTASSLDGLDNVLFSLAEKNNVKEIVLTGADTYCILVKDRIDNLSKLRYGINNELRVNIIE